MEKKLSPISQPVHELPVANLVQAQEYYRDTPSFEIDWLFPTRDTGRRPYDNRA
ncbi:MAG: hypothetical protein NPIRA05_11960 [Nitrospirales bacterium]|nr:MAG: hypothetical protein NPIRA05_11960 [Nitrospirales bacterium]